MQTAIRSHVVPAGSIFTGEGKATMSTEIDYRMNRLLSEASQARLATPQTPLRQRIGHGLIAIGRAIHGVETESAPRPAMQGR